MKILFFTDTHIRQNNPRNRIDNYYETCLKKLEEIREYANDNSIDFCIHGGDLFDRPDSSIKSTSDVGKLFGGFSMPIYIVPGNHDIYGYNINTLNRSMLGLLDSLSVIKLIPDDGIVIEKDGLKVFLMGTPYSSKLDTDKNNYIVQRSNLKIEDDCKYIINVCHGFLLDKPFLENVPHVLIGEILDTDADITLAGHYHNGFKTQVHNGKYFANPGSLLRITGSKFELVRRPKFLEIEIDEDKISISDRYLKSAKNGDEVIDRTKLLDDKLKMERLTIFSDEIDQNADFRMLDIESILSEISKSEKLDSRILDEAKMRIDKAKEKIDDRNN